ncbi:hypothetical protein NLI96_g5298 [Meripilus lineatus]|uniref:Uncharacterized protein n=1 Tax=Meripilus lineatus TaxID=2056292 RepID=A0AAD5V4Z9_9APHY|nr:hypothetical protein NLI96_g5298 [Physisporinus lineatus]
MPLVTILTRSDPLKCEAYSFLAGSLGDLSLTLWFTPILFWTELLAIVAGMGCVISSGITLVIFFPRSIASEIAAKDASRDNKHSLQQLNTYRTTQLSDGFDVVSGGVKMTSLSDYRGTHDATSSMGHRDFDSPSPIPIKSAPNDLEAQLVPPTATERKREDRHNKNKNKNEDGKSKTVMTFSPNRRADAGGTIEGGVTVLRLTEQNLARHDLRTGSLNPLVHNFTSPIDLMDHPTPKPRAPPPHLL